LKEPAVKKGQGNPEAVIGSSGAIYAGCADRLQRVLSFEPRAKFLGTNCLKSRMKRKQSPMFVGIFLPERHSLNSRLQTP
jgi:hypothetical protein